MKEKKENINDNLTLRKKFIKYLLPSVAAMWVFSLYTMIDGIFVSRGVGPVALAAVNISMPFVNFIFALSMLFSTGVSTVIAIYLGQNKLDKAREAFSFNVLCIIVVSISITIISLINIDKITLFLGATDATFQLVKDYLKIIMIFNAFFIISYCLEVLSKTDGFPHLSIIGMIISAVTNIVLDFIFVILLGFGIKGAAFATIISQGVSCLFFLIHFLSSRGKLQFVKFKINFEMLKRILYIGFPDAITELTSGVVILLFNQTILKYIGEDGIITYSIISYVNTLVIMTMIAITQGMQPLSSYHYGKNENNVVKKLLKMSIKTIAFSSIFIFMLCIVFANPIVSIFLKGQSPELFAYSVSSFRIFSITFLVLGFNVLTSGYFASIEKTFDATIISLSRGLVLITIVLIAMTSLFGEKGIWISTLISELLCLIISITLLYKNKLSFKKTFDKTI